MVDMVSSRRRADDTRRQTYFPFMAAEKHSNPNSTVHEALELIAPAYSHVVRLYPDAAITAANFEYADLLKGGELGRAVEAVIEKDGTPLIYVASMAPDQVRRAQGLARLLGNRGETALLLDVHRTPDSGQLVGRAWTCSLDVDHHTPVDLASPVDAASVLGDLQEGLWSQGEAYQEQRLRDLLVQSVSTVRAAFREATNAPNERSEEALALMGRALFTRFLLDRGILSATTAPELAAVLEGDGARVFSSASAATMVCKWLDDTFNGEFLPLPAHNGYEQYFEQLIRQSPGALTPLSWIVGKTDAGGQLPMWDLLDFSHIPVGILSEVYEDYVHERSPSDAKAKSVHFTPRHIARMMVRQAMAGLPLERAAEATVLDPSVGAAVYLSLAYRELARLRQLRDGRWPDTRILRGILYEQLSGMDISCSALNLAALTLYLTAIELDENPVPPEKLKFERRLVGTVLLDVGRRDPEQPHAEVLGSLRRNSGLNRRYDVVIGNPPWTSIGRAPKDDDGKEGEEPSDAFSAEADVVARGCIERRLGNVKDYPYAHPDKVPDLAFIWKSTEWAVDEGIISLIVHQRLLTKRSDGWRQARKALFSALQIDGILDASEFVNHNDMFWPGIESPYCVLFARNNKPPAGHETSLMTLAVEPVLTKRRQIRLDPTTVARLRPEDFDEKPGGIVTRLKGCELDIALLARWQSRFEANADVPHGRFHGARALPLITIRKAIAKFALDEPRRGYKKGSKGAKLRDWVEDLPASTKHLDARSQGFGGEVQANDIHAEFAAFPMKSTPPLGHYRPPMLLLHQGAGKFGELRRSTIVTPNAGGDHVVYPFAFLGAPFEFSSQNLLYAKYVALWANSSVLSYFATLTSTQFGFGIKTLNNEDLLNTPIVDMQLAFSQRLTDTQEVEALFSGLGRPNITLAHAIDEWVARVMGIDADEMQLIEDTLSVSYPNGPSRHSGRSWVTVTDMDAYVAQLRTELSEVADLIDVQSVQALPEAKELAGWRFVTWRAREQALDGGASLEDVNPQRLLRLVRDSYPTGQVWATVPGGIFVFGQMALRRLWLPSRACLAAQVLIAWIDQNVA